MVEAAVIVFVGFCVVLPLLALAVGDG